jgi:hypothetical protein
MSLQYSIDIHTYLNTVSTLDHPTIPLSAHQCGYYHHALPVTALSRSLRYYSVISLASLRSHDIPLAHLHYSRYRSFSNTQTKKVVLRLECTVCKVKHQLTLKRTKHFELGGDKKQVSLYFCDSERSAAPSMVRA